MSFISKLWKEVARPIAKAVIPGYAAIDSAVSGLTRAVKGGGGGSVDTIANAVDSMKSIQPVQAGGQTAQMGAQPMVLPVPAPQQMPQPVTISVAPTFGFSPQPTLAPLAIGAAGAAAGAARMLPVIRRAMPIAKRAAEAAGALKVLRKEQATPPGAKPPALRQLEAKKRNPLMRPGGETELERKKKKPTKQRTKTCCVAKTPTAKAAGKRPPRKQAAKKSAPRAKGKLTGRAKQEFLDRMAKGRAKASRSSSRP